MCKKDQLDKVCLYLMSLMTGTAEYIAFTNIALANTHTHPHTHTHSMLIVAPSTMYQQS